MPSMFSRIHGLVRLHSGLRSFLNNSIDAGQSLQTVQEKMKRREAIYLQMLDCCIFQNHSSPYLKLFKASGCERGDVEKLVRQEGIEHTQNALFAAGIYVTSEEFKGTQTAVRGSQRFTFKAGDFDNKLITSHYESTTGGSSGNPVRLFIDLEHISQTALNYALWFLMNGWIGQPLVFWTPSHVGIANGYLRCAKFDNYLVKSFSMVKSSNFKERVIAEVVHAIVRKAAGFPKPESVPVSEAWKVGAYLSELLDKGLSPCIRTTPSGAVRICMAALERKKCLTNVAFLVTGEPLTSHRRAIIESSGASVFSTYGCSEGSIIGSQCMTPKQHDDVHVFKDAFSIGTRKRVIDGEREVDSLLLTGLRMAAPKVMFNVEIGDCGTLEERECGCLFDQAGYTTHLHSIRSFERFTGEGVTIIGSDLIKLLEYLLPQKFGGSMMDYQFVEEHSSSGITHYFLLVSPDIGVLDEAKVGAYFLEELGKTRSHYREMTNLWRQCQTFRVKRGFPALSPRGKLKHFRIISNTENSQIN